jgi:hypothetical protein
MRVAEIQVKVNIARREMEYWQSLLKNKVCGECQNFQQGNCLKFNARPPGGDKEPGCDEWSWDEIPFN